MVAILNEGHGCKTQFWMGTKLTMDEWVSDCCLMPTQPFSVTTWQEEQINFQ